MINSLPFPKKTWFFLLSLVLVIVFLLALLFVRPISSPVAPTPSPTPFVFQGDADILEKRETLIKEQFPLLDFLPYQSKNFSIGYVGPLRLKISLWAQDQEAAKNEALSWLKEKGINPQTHLIDWEAFFIPEP